MPVQESRNIPHSMSAMGTTGRFAHKVMQTGPMRQGFNFAADMYGFGKYGAFNPAAMQVGVAGTGAAATTAGGRAMAGARAAGKGTMASGMAGWRAVGRQIGRQGARGSSRALAGMAGRTVFGPLLTGYFTYQGFKEGGIMGAAKELAMTTAISWGLGTGLSMVGGASAILGPAAVVGGMGYGAYKALEHGNARIKKTRQMELGSPVVDPFGTAGTMRERSARALMFSQTNGRTAFGNEAALMHMPMR